MQMELDYAQGQAKAQLDTIHEMVETLETAQEAGDDEEAEEAMQRIREDPLSVEVRTGWHQPTALNAKPEEYCLLLCTGGPAVRIIGDLDERLEPTSAHMQCQDWFKPWQNVPTTIEDENAMLTYARCFYYGG